MQVLQFLKKVGFSTLQHECCAAVFYVRGVGYEAASQINRGNVSLPANRVILLHKLRFWKSDHSRIV